jgi:hypothetical protein
MWVYPGSRYLDRPSPEELCVTEVEAQICKVMDFAIILSHGDDPNPL